MTATGGFRVQGPGALLLAGLLTNDLVTPAITPGLWRPAHAQALWWCRLGHPQADASLHGSSFVTRASSILSPSTPPRLSLVTDLTGARIAWLIGAHGFPDAGYIGDSHAESRGSRFVGGEVSPVALALAPKPTVVALAWAPSRLGGAGSGFSPVASRRGEICMRPDLFGWPALGAAIDDRPLPQEVRTILSGCVVHQVLYTGQETVARRTSGPPQPRLRGSGGDGPDPSIRTI